MAHATEFAGLVVIVSAGVALVATWRSLPLTPLLLALGLLLGAVPWAPAFHLDPDVILFVFLPPLLFEAAFALDLDVVWSMRRGVLVLAVPGVLLGAAVIG